MGWRAQIDAQGSRLETSSEDQRWRERSNELTVAEMAPLHLATGRDPGSAPARRVSEAEMGRLRRQAWPIP